MATANQDPAKIRARGLEWAQNKCEKMFEDSKIHDQSADFPRFDFDEVVLGKVLGKGGFGTVSEVRAFKITGVTQTNRYKSKSFRNIMVARQDTSQDPIMENGDTESRHFIAEHCVRKSGDARYALKTLSKETCDDMALFFQGVVDMAVETRFLSDIEHPNIIKLRALAKCTPYSEQYFIVMDRLYDTLENRLEKWSVRLKRQSSMFRDRSGTKARDLYEERIVVAFDLASAVEYLHTRNILYRDLKPENIGFDIRDDVKLFDFGLAKELHENEMDKDGTYKLTGMTGSPRYMAPEVAREEQYNHMCDSYSFAIMFWQILACKEPFELYTMKSFKTRVWDPNGELKRPFIQDDWTVPMKILLKRSWDNDWRQRNSITNIAKALREECVRVRHGNEAGLEHMRRRSTFVFRPKKGKTGGNIVDEGGKRRNAGLPLRGLSAGPP